MKILRALILLALPFVGWSLISRQPTWWWLVFLLGALIIVLLVGRLSAAPKFLRLTPPLLLWTGGLSAAYFVDVRLFFWLSALLVGVSLVLFVENAGVTAAREREETLRGQLTPIAIVLATVTLIFFTYVGAGAVSFFSVSPGWVALALLAIYAALAVSLAQSQGELRPAFIWIMTGSLIFVEWVWATFFLPFTSMAIAALQTLGGIALLVLMTWALSAEAQKRFTRRRLIVFTVVLVCATVGILLLTRWV